MKTNGKLTVIIGPMFASKSTTLIAKCRRLSLAGKRCIMVRHPMDTRYQGHDQHVITHDGNKFEAITCSDDKIIMPIYNQISQYDAVFIDEGQFYEDIANFCDTLANDGKVVFCSGLYADAHREPFQPMTKLLAVADDIIFQTAVDPINGEDAPFTDFSSQSMARMPPLRTFPFQLTAINKSRLAVLNFIDHAPDKRLAS